jgi:hypothetical protein
MELEKYQKSINDKDIIGTQCELIYKKMQTVF